MINTKIIYCLTACLLISGSLCAQSDQLLLKNRIIHIIDTAGGKFGVGVEGVDFKGGFIINGKGRYPMQSVFKFPLALAILHQVDLGKLKLDQKFFMPKEKLDTKTWSPMLKDFPNQDLNMTLSQLLSYAVTKSDNNACDFLYGVAGGPAAVTNYLHGLGVKDISIKYTEGEMQNNWSFQYQDWCRPAAMLQLLQLLYHQRLLSKHSNDFLIKIMTEIPGWAPRITLLLPPNTELIHKTGSSGTNAQGMMAATNDVGIVTLPNGKHLAIVIYASDYKGPLQRGEHIIGVISKQIWDFYTKRSSR